MTGWYMNVSGSVYKRMNNFKIVRNIYMYNKHDNNIII